MTFPTTTTTEDLRTVAAHANNVLRTATWTAKGERVACTAEELAKVERVGLKALHELDRRGEAARCDTGWLRAPGC